MFMDFPMFPSKTSIETTLSTAMFGASGARLSAWLQLCVSGLSSSQCYADEGRVSSVYHLSLQPVRYREIPGYHVIYTLYKKYTIGFPSCWPLLHGRIHWNTLNICMIWINNMRHVFAELESEYSATMMVSLCSWRFYKKPQCTYAICHDTCDVTIAHSVWPYL